MTRMVFLGLILCGLFFSGSATAKMGQPNWTLKVGPRGVVQAVGVSQSAQSLAAPSGWKCTQQAPTGVTVRIPAANAPDTQTDGWSMSVTCSTGDDQTVEIIVICWDNTQTQADTASMIVGSKRESFIYSAKCSR